MATDDRAGGDPLAAGAASSSSQAGDQFARMLRGSALPTLAAGIGCVVVAAATGGAKPAWSAGLGAALVVVFFALSLLVMQRTAHLEPTAVMATVLATYTGKLVALGAAMILLRDAPWLSGRALAFTIIVCTVVWLAFEVRAFTRMRVPVTIPQSGDVAASPAPRPGDDR